MQIHSSLAAAAAAIRPTPVALTIGNFDGVHLGHRALIDAVRGSAARIGGVSVIMTFSPHPEAVLRGAAPEALTTLDRRLSLLAETGIDHVIVQTFDVAFAAIEAEAFLRGLAVDLGVRRLVLGHDFRYGHGGRGDVELARRLGPELGFEVEQVEAVLEGGEPISSSRIRRVLSIGDVEKAHRLLGRPWRIEGRVSRGAGRGKTLGFPTINLATGQPLIVPDGVYGGVATTSDGGRWVAAISVGTNPTFGDEPRHFEAFLLEYPYDTVSGDCAIELRQWLRGQIAYSHAAPLIAQIEADVRTIREQAATGGWLRGD